MFPMTLFFRTHQGFQGSPASGRHSQSTYSRALPQSHQFKQLGTPGKIWKRVSHLQKSKSKYVSEFTSLKMELIHVYTRENPGVLKTITFSHPSPGFGFPSPTPIIPGGSLWQGPVRLRQFQGFAAHLAMLLLQWEM